MSVTKIISRNDADGQTVSYLTQVDIKQGNLGIKASYSGYYTKESTAASRSELVESGLSWDMQQTTKQAAAYEAASDTTGQVVMATNGDYYNMQTGAPLGYLIMEGNVVRSGDEPYFAILKDGTATIRDASETDTSDVVEAVSGPFYLIQDGEIVVDASNTDLMPRNSVGIKADGSVVFYEADGRQAPYSAGLTLYDTACMLLEAGCVDALYLDGGGSATVAAKYEGTDLAVVNSPSDGTERTVSSTLLVVSYAESDGVFDHASVSPRDEYYTLGSEVEFTATGVDANGGAAPLPENGLTWSLGENYGDAGYIDEETGVFIAAENYTGDVEVCLSYEGSVVGSAEIMIVEPEKITFSSSSISLDFEEESDLGLSAFTADGLEIHFKSGDFTWTTTNEAAGSVTDNVFTACEKTDETQTTDLTASHTKMDGTVISATISIEVGKMPVIVMDFESEEVGTAYSVTNAGSTTVSTEIVDSDSGEVRFGEKSLLFHYDYTNYSSSEQNINEAVLVPTFTDANGDSVNSIDLEGSPTAIGMWVYVPEGTSNFWIGTWVSGYTQSRYDSGGSSGGYQGYANTFIHFKTTTTNAAGETVDITTQYTGINWSGWQYIEADLSSLYTIYEVSEEHPLKLITGRRLLNLIYIAGGTPDIDGNKITCGSKSSGDIYIDNVRLVYGTTVDDLDNPVITSLSGGSTSLSTTELTEIAADGSTVLTSNELQFFTEYYDPQGDNYTGIDADSIVITVDGETVTVVSNADQAVTGDTLYMPNGTHTIAVEVADGFGNKTSIERTLTVAAEESSLPGISISYLESAEIGNDYTISLASDKVADISSATIKIVYGNVNKFDLYDADAEDYGGASATATSAELSFGSNFSESQYEVERKTGSAKTVTIYATNSSTEESAASDNVIATFSLGVPRWLTSSDTLPISVTVSYTTTDGKTLRIATGSKSISMEASYTIDSGIVVEGMDSSTLYVTDSEGNPLASATIYSVSYEETIVYENESDTDNSAYWTVITPTAEEIGSTDEDGKLSVNTFTSKSAGETTAIYVEKDGHYSFDTTVTTLSAGGGSEDTPIKDIQLNAGKDADTTQNITWLSNPLYSSATAIVKYGTTESSLNRTVEGTSTLHAFTTSASAAYINSVTLDWLPANTTIYYKVGDGTHWSDVRSFTTDSGDTGETTRFFVSGDTQLSGSVTSDEDEIALMDYIAESINVEAVDFGIQTGDFVDNGGNLTMWEEILDVYTENYATTPIVHVMGNHEYYDDLEGEAAEMLWNLADENYYSVEYGNVYVAVINYCADLAEACEWLIADAQASGCQWKILTVHQPAYYTNPLGSSEAFNKYIPSAAEAAGINAVFSGHDHSYARTEVLSSGSVVESEINGSEVATYGEGIVYFICGDLGEKSRESSYAINNSAGFNFAVATQDYTAVYLDVQADAEALTITAYDVNSDGTIEALDSFSMYTEDGACAANGHDLTSEVPVYQDGALLCNACGDAIDPAEVSYTGEAADAETGRMMYFYQGQYQTGWYQIVVGEERYCFDENGVAYDGVYTLNGVELTFENGLVVSGPDGFVTGDDGYTYYYVNGEPTTGLAHIDSDYYYFYDGDSSSDQYGAMCTASKTFGVTSYTFYDDGTVYVPMIAELSEDSGIMRIEVRASVKEEVYGKVTVALWSYEKGYTSSGELQEQDDLRWFTMSYEGEGLYAVDVPMCLYSDTGRYIAHSYADDSLYKATAIDVTTTVTHSYTNYTAVKNNEELCGDGVVKVAECDYGCGSTDTIGTAPHVLTAEVSDDCRSMEITMTTETEHTHDSVRFAVWSSNDGQDDLKWYTAESDGNGTWTYTVNLEDHESDGIYNIHAYSGSSYLTATTANVAVAVSAVEYTVTFTGESVETSESVTNTAYGFKVVMPTDPVREGYSFTGWNTQEDGSGDAFTADSVVEADMTVYAQWEMIDYTVTFTGESVETSTAVSNDASEFKVTLPTDPTRDDYAFIGWNTQEDGSGDEFTADSIVKEDITVYAQWEMVDYTVTFAGESVETSTAVTNDANEFKVALPTDPTRDGYTFTGWNTKANGRGDEFTADSTVHADTTVYAQWETIDYTVTFKNGKTEVSKATANVESSYLVKVPTLTADSQRFVGWYDEDGNLFTASTEVSADMTVTARWESYHFTVNAIEDMEYTGKAIKPKPEVYDGATKLTKGVDYTLSYSSNTNLGTATITITGKGNYTDKTKVEFEIVQRDISNEDVVSLTCTTQYVYKGQEPNISAVLKNGSVKMTKNKDYEFSFDRDVTEAGTYTLIIAGTGNYTGTREVEITLTEELISVSKLSIGKISNQEYNGTAYEPKPTISYKGEELTEDEDYTLTYANSDKAGTASVTITGIGKYKGTKTLSYRIIGVALSKVKVSGVEPVVYRNNTDGIELENLVLTYDGATLTEGVDYTLTYSNNTKVGTAKVVITGIGGYTGTLRKSYKITPYQLTSDGENLITVDEVESEAYTKKGAKAKPAVYFDGELLTEGTDYKLSWKNYKTVGATATVTVTGKGNFKGVLATQDYTVESGDLSAGSVTVSDVAYRNRANNFKSTLAVYDAGGSKLSTKDYEIVGYYDEWGDPIEEKSIVETGSEITVELRGKGNYSDDSTLQASWRVATLLKGAKVTVLSKFAYTGEAVTLTESDLQVIKNKDELGTDQYEILEGTYKNNTKVGTASVQIRGLGEYGGTITVKFKIAKRVIGEQQQ